MSDNISISELAEAYGAPSKPAEKPDELVERCAKEPGQVAFEEYQSSYGLKSHWACVANADSARWARVEKAVLQAAGVERLREDLKKARQDAGRYFQKGVTAIGRADHEARRAAVAETALAEARRERDEWKARAEAKQPNGAPSYAALEKVAEAARRYIGFTAGDREWGEQEHPIGRVLVEALEALDAAQPKAEPANDESYSLPSDDWTGWADEVEEHRHRLAADDRRLNEHSADIIAIARILQGAMGAVSATDLMALRGIIKRNEQ